MPSILVKAPGDANIPKVEKFASESIIYTLDCSGILETNEIITQVLPVPSMENISLSNIRTRKGAQIELRVENSPILSSTYIDYRLSILFITNVGNKKVANFIIRVHK